MSVILDEADWPKWLGEAPATEDDLVALLKPSEGPRRPSGGCSIEALAEGPRAISGGRAWYPIKIKLNFDVGVGLRFAA